LRSRALPVFSLVLALGLGAWARKAARDLGFWADDYAQYAMLEHAYPSTIGQRQRLAAPTMPDLHVYAPLSAATR
jgi:hypothetical protein